MLLTQPSLEAFSAPSILDSTVSYDVRDCDRERLARSFPDYAWTTGQEGTTRY